MSKPLYTTCPCGIRHQVTETDWQPSLRKRFAFGCICGRDCWLQIVAEYKEQPKKEK